MNTERYSTTTVMFIAICRTQSYFLGFVIHSESKTLEDLQTEDAGDGYSLAFLFGRSEIDMQNRKRLLYDSSSPNGE